MRTYNLNSINFGLILRERWEQFNDQSAVKYFDKSFKKFQSRLEQFKNSPGTLSEQQIKELHFMLAALIEAKHSKG